MHRLLTRSGQVKRQAFFLTALMRRPECQLLALRRAAVATLERADSIFAHPGAFSQGRLRESSDEPVVPKAASQAG